MKGAKGYCRVFYAGIRGGDQERGRKIGIYKWLKNITIIDK
jgi:hypothetical protein